MAKRDLPPRMYKKYRVFYYVVRVDGKKKWIRLSDDYQEALFKYAELEGNPQTTELIKDAIEKYRLEILPGKAEKTRSERKYQLDRLSRVFGAMHYQALQPKHLQAYLQARTDKKGNPAPVAANREVKLLSTIYRHCIVWGFCDANPCENIFYHPEKGRDRYISDDELKTLRDNADEMTRAIIDIAYCTGMRKSDILQIKTADVTQEGLYNRQNKTEKRQLFKYTPKLKTAVDTAKAIKKTRRTSDNAHPLTPYLFINSKGRVITNTGFNSTWRRLKAAQGFVDDKNLTFHDIRAKALTDAKKKHGIEYAQELGGHENASQTEHYIKSKSTDEINALE